MFRAVIFQKTKKTTLVDCDMFYIDVWLACHIERMCRRSGVRESTGHFCWYLRVTRTIERLAQNGLRSE